MEVLATLILAVVIEYSVLGVVYLFGDVVEEWSADFVHHEVGQLQLPDFPNFLFLNVFGQHLVPLYNYSRRFAVQ